MTKDNDDRIRVAYNGWGRALVVAWQPDVKIKESFFRDINVQSISTVADILSLMNLEYVERKPAKVIHYIADNDLLYTPVIEVASQYITVVSRIKQLRDFDDKKIDPAIVDEWLDFKHRALSGDEEFFEGEDFLSKAVYCLGETAKLINEYDLAINNSESLDKFQTNLAKGNILNFVRYCPNGGDIAMKNLPAEIGNNYKRYFDSIAKFKSERQRKTESANTLNAN
ncbi:MAG: hypothetical protein IKQ31_03405 [Clostridia bacterium]|nr:hypothetical protein [Clostridia bacterium]